MKSIVGMRFEHSNQLKECLQNHPMSNGYRLWWPKKYNTEVEDIGSFVDMTANREVVGNVHDQVDVEPVENVQVNVEPGDNGVDLNLEIVPLDVTKGEDIDAVYETQAIKKLKSTPKIIAKCKLKTMNNESGSSFKKK